MSRGGEDGVPVWGIEAGPGVIRAARVVRREEGGFFLLDYQEGTAEGPGPEAVVSFLRRRGLRRHPLVVAIQSPSAHIATVALPPEEVSGNAEEMRLSILEYVHPEPEQVDLRWSRQTENLFLLCSEDRARVESFLVSLETAGVPAYALVSDLDALLCVVRGLGLFEGDGVLVRVKPRSTDLLFLDGPAVRLLGLPVGARDLASDEVLDLFAADVERLIEYHRTRVPREDPERIVLLGLEGPEAERIGARLPERPLPFPGDAGPVRGKGRIGMARCLSILRIAPAAVGAAIAGAAEPRRLELSFRRLPDELPRPPASSLPFLAAAALLWLALAAAWLGTSGELRRLESARDTLASPPSPQVSEAAARRIRTLVPQARSLSTLPEAVRRVLAAVPGEEAAPYRTERLALRALEGGAWEARIALALTGPGHGPDSSRGRALRERIGRLPASEIEAAPGEEETIYRIRIRLEGPR